MSSRESYIERLRRYLPRRRYSVTELAEMRGALWRLSSSIGAGGYNPDALSAKVERQMWTHIQNGTPVAELVAQAEKWERDDRARWDRELAATKRVVNSGANG